MRFSAVIALVLASVSTAAAGDSIVELRLAAGPSLVRTPDDATSLSSSALGVIQLALVDASGPVGGLERQFGGARVEDDGRLLVSMSDVYIGWGWGAPDGPWRFELAPLAGIGWFDERFASAHERDIAIEVGARAAASRALGAHWRLGLEARAWRDQAVIGSIGSGHGRPELIVRGGAILGTVSYRIF